MSVKNETGEWMNRNGRYVPPETINRATKKRDKVVGKIMKKTLALRMQMLLHKGWVQKEIEKYMKYLEKHAGVNDVDTKGNLTLSDYANLNAVEISVNDVITFDERLNLAKGIIDKCLRKWTGKSNRHIKAIVDEAFNVDKKGSVNKMMILRLLNIEIKDAEWMKAMNMIRESIDVTGTRKYLSFRKRTNCEEKFESLNLNFSSM